MDIAETTFEEPPQRFRQHFVILAILAIVTTALSLLIWWIVPNEGDGPLLGRLLDGLRDALLVILWGALAIFSATSTAVLAIVLDRMAQYGMAPQADVDAAKKADIVLDLYRDIFP